MHVQVLESCCNHNRPLPDNLHRIVTDMNTKGAKSNKQGSRDDDARNRVRAERDKMDSQANERSFADRGAEGSVFQETRSVPVVARHHGDTVYEMIKGS